MESFTDIEKFANQLDKNYFLFKEESLKKRRIKHSNIVPLVEKAAKSKGIEQSKLGESTEGRAIYLLKIGSGKTKVLLWSQMHGDEPTATQALFDIFKLFSSPGLFEEEIENIFWNFSSNGSMCFKVIYLPSKCVSKLPLYHASIFIF